MADLVRVNLHTREPKKTTLGGAVAEKKIHKYTNNGLPSANNAL